MPTITDKNHAAWKTIGSIFSVLALLGLCIHSIASLTTPKASPTASRTAQQGQPPGNSDVVPQEKPSEEWKRIGTLQGLGQAFYDNLPFADIAKGEQADGVMFSEEFCPSGTATYKEVTWNTAMYADLVPSGHVEDEVCEGPLTANYFVTSDEPRHICLSNTHGQKPLPRMKIGAKPGDTWKYEWPCHPSGEQPYSTFSYVRAVRFHGHECALISDEQRNSLAGRDILVRRFERWYAKGIGLVKEDIYSDLYLGVRGNHMIHSSSAYWIGK